MREELAGYHPKLIYLRFVQWVCPHSTMQRVRTHLLRLGGLNIGSASVFADVPTFTGGVHALNNLTVGIDCFFNVGCIFDLGDTLTIENDVYFGHRVTIITSSHEIGPEWHRASDVTTAPVTIGEGVWLAANVTVLPGVTIGRGTIVAAGAVVTKDLPANVLAAGIPAKPIKDLPFDPPEHADTPHE